MGPVAGRSAPQQVQPLPGTILFFTLISHACHGDQQRNPAGRSMSVHRVCDQCRLGGGFNPPLSLYLAVMIGVIVFLILYPKVVLLLPEKFGHTL